MSETAPSVRKSYAGEDLLWQAQEKAHTKRQSVRAAEAERPTSTAVATTVRRSPTDDTGRAGEAAADDRGNDGAGRPVRTGTGQAAAASTIACETDCRGRAAPPNAQAEHSGSRCAAPRFASGQASAVSPGRRRAARRLHPRTRKAPLRRMGRRVRHFARVRSLLDDPRHVGTRRNCAARLSAARLGPARLGASPRPPTCQADPAHRDISCVRSFCPKRLCRLTTPP